MGIDYKQKYLKYKIKYLNAKKKFRGGMDGTQVSIKKNIIRVDNEGEQKTFECNEVGAVGPDGNPGGLDGNPDGPDGNPGGPNTGVQHSSDGDPAAAMEAQAKKLGKLKEDFDAAPPEDKDAIMENINKLKKEMLGKLNAELDAANKTLTNANNALELANKVINEYFGNGVDPPSFLLPTAEKNASRDSNLPIARAAATAYKEKAQADIEVAQVIVDIANYRIENLENLDTTGVKAELVKFKEKEDIAKQKAVDANNKLGTFEATKLVEFANTYKTTDLSKLIK